MNTARTALAASLIALLAIAPATADAQLGRQQGLVEPNVAADSTVAALPHLNTTIAEALRAARPILSAVTLDSILGAHAITRAQRTDVYGRLFVHVDINRGSDAELMLIPGMDAQKLGAIKAGRPWATFAAFQSAMAAASSATEATRLEQYLFIPIELNSFTEPIMDSFASIGVGTRQWKREFAEYRPWRDMAQFERDIGKYLRSRPSELQRLARYVIIAP
jgi:hypothetical protein